MYHCHGKKEAVLLSPFTLFPATHTLLSSRLTHIRDETKMTQGKSCFIKTAQTFFSLVLRKSGKQPFSLAAGIFHQLSHTVKSTFRQAIDGSREAMEQEKARQHVRKCCSLLLLGDTDGRILTSLAARHQVKQCCRLLPVTHMKIIKAPSHHF